MKSKRAGVLFPLIISIILLFSCFYGTSAEKLRLRKLVYVVIDDSWSMDTNPKPSRWQNAQYALEVLAGVLNPDDRLVLHYLNENNPNRKDMWHPERENYSQWEAKLDTSPNLQNTMQTIVDTGYPLQGNPTPFTTVESAFQELFDTSKTTIEEFDQYWLVVMTDGNFNPDIDHTNINVSKAEIVNSFSKFVSTPLGPNSHGELQMIYFTIGDYKADKTIIDETGSEKQYLEKRHIYCYDSTSAKLIETMGEIADRISGRGRITGSELQYIPNSDRTAITFTPPLPISNFVVLRQAAGGDLYSAKSDVNGALRIPRSAEIVPPDYSLLSTHSGSIYTVDNGDQVIERGTITLEFDNTIDKEKIIVLYEPAIDIIFTYSVNGTVLTTDPENGTRIGQSLSVSAELFKSNSDEKIDWADLPQGTTFELKVTNGSQSDTKTSVGEPAVIQKLTGEDVVVEGTLVLPGINTVRFRNAFTPDSAPDWIGSVSDAGGTQSGTLYAKTEELKQNQRNKYLEFRIQSGVSAVTNLKDLFDQGVLLIDSPDISGYDIEFFSNDTLRFYPYYDSSVTLQTPHTVSVFTQGKADLIAQGEVIVEGSSYEVRVEMPDSVTLTMTEFQKAGEQSFFFTLYSDGNAVNAEDYDISDIVFSERNGKLPNPTFNVENHKWKVTIPYSSNIREDTYEIIAAFRRIQSSHTAKLVIGQPHYVLTADQQRIILSQAELSEGKTELHISLTEDSSPISPAAVTVDWGQLTPGRDKTDPQTNVRTLTLVGALTTDPKEYEIRIEYTSPDGQNIIQSVAVTVTESVYNITPVFTRKLRFVSVQELQANQEQYRFEITVDNRELTPAEMLIPNLINMDVTPDDTCTEWTVNGSGYDVLPRAKPGWTPPGNDVTYTVTCTVPGKTESIEFIYHFAEYRVELISGDGTNIEADKLIDNHSGLKFAVFLDNIQLPQAEVENRYSFSVNKPFSVISLEETVDPDGTITLNPTSHYPKILDFFVRPLPFLRPTGDMQITLTFSGKQSDGTLHLIKGSLLHWWPYPALVLAIIILVLYLIKRRFNSKTYIYYCLCQKKGDKYIGTKNMQRWSLTSDFWHIIVPHPARHQTEIQGLKIRAADYSGIEVFINSGWVAKSISTPVSDKGKPQVTNPMFQAPMEAGWQRMNPQDVIIIVEQNNAVNGKLFKYS